MEASSGQSPSIHATQGRAPLAQRPVLTPSQQQVSKAQETKEAFSDFVGKTFYGQLLKSMRQTVGKPAYFHGGRAEEVFRSQLDQTIADHMTNSQGAGLAEGAFRQQFPAMADVLDRHEQIQEQQSAGLQQLAALRRR